MNLRPSHARAAMLLIAGLLCRATLADDAPFPATAPAATQPVPAVGGGTTVETIVIFRHGEKPSKGLGNLTPQGLNRALAISTVLPKKFGKPDYLFAPDPKEKVSDKGGSFNYVRPLATIEPLAIRLEMPVQTPCGFTEIDKLNKELTSERYASATLFVAWEHIYAQKAAANLIKQFDGDVSQVPTWKGPDYDSLYVVKITRVPGTAAVATFTLDHENLNGLSTAMPVPAEK